ncbi:SusD/RagB family nutrient-binding outer membrane lipoprotein [Aquimarina brevivitae]|uniref:SusD-like starch-binding protein associating with outer membrane n=1 Tax=Aquimarina brevivitae TaxID=323412 RepID=A0A4Q7PLS1_9FLAO|nr:SusD/RagB family nutrient-binding outer membrane lipoprotein [Aquimarina brevivitae]RZS99942.1 SusD-like starch-binding protein associating with outer membrane [Aquimarina brevivitae]
MKNKHIKLIILSLLVGIGFTACETTDLDQLQDPTDVTIDQLDPDQLFNNIQLGFNGFVQATAGDASFSAQVTRSFAMTGGNQYANAFAPISFNGIWSAAYAGVLNDIQTLEPVAEEQGLTYQLGASKVMRAYVLVTLVDLFGDVPYSEALQGNGNLNPGADDQVSIYQAALDELDEAISILGVESTSLPSDDLYFALNNGGSVEVELQDNWITAAKTLKLRIYTQAKDAGTELGVNITAEINSLLAENDLIDTPSEDWQFNYGTNRVNPNSRHPGYNRYYEAAATGYMSNYLMWAMIDEKGAGDDPRLRYYFYRQDSNANNEDIFTLGCIVQSAPGHYGNESSIYDNSIGMPFCVADAGRGYWGRDHGDNGGIPPDDEKRTVYGVYPVGGSFDIDDAGSIQNEGEDGGLGAGITPIILSSYVHFLKAEAQLTAGATGDARASLEAGIRASMDKVLNFDPATASSPFAATATNVNAYVTVVLDAYDAAGPNDRLDIVMKEYFIASFGNGLETYNGYRRTGLPSNFQPTLDPNPGDYYRSALYPANYINNNSNATQKERTEKIFWDKNPDDGFIN